MKFRAQNIIFDLGGVLFEHSKIDATLFSSINDGLELLNKCYLRQDSSGNRLYKLYVCSNWKTERINRLKEEFPIVFAMFDGVVFATLAQAKKPDLRIYNYLLNAYCLDPRECIFLDDQFQNIEAARTLGMHGICVDNFNAVELNLRELGIL